MILGQALDVNGNYLARVKVESLASDPAASEYLSNAKGAMYFNTTDNSYRINNGTEWVKVVKINGTSGRISVTYSGSPAVATIDLVSVVTAGTGTKITYDGYGRVTSSTSLAASDMPSGIDAAKIANGTVSNTEFQYLDGVTSAIQTQINSKQSTSEKGQPNGYASLDSNGKVPTSQLPEEIFGNMTYKGTWNGSTNTPTLPAPSSTNKGWYYIVSVAGSASPTGLNPIVTPEWKIGDWIVSDGTYWDKVDNTDQVTSVFGRMGAITATNGDYTASQITNVPYSTTSSVTVQAAINELTDDIGTLNANVVVKNPTAQQVIVGQSLKIERSSASNDAYYAGVTGDAFTRWLVSSNGTINWGNGSVARDTNLYRATANYLKTDDTFESTQLKINGYDSASMGGTGPGLELNYTAGYGRILTYDRTLNTRIPLRLDALELQFHSGEPSSIRMTITSDGNINIPGLTASRVVVTDASKNLVSSSIDTTHLDYLSDVTSNIQAQLNGKQNTLTNPVTGTGATNQITTWNGTTTVTGSNKLTYNNLTLSIGTSSDTAEYEILRFETERQWAFKKYGTGATTSLGLVSTVNAKEFSIGQDTGTGLVPALTVTANAVSSSSTTNVHGYLKLSSLTGALPEVAFLQADGTVARSSITSTELGYLDNATSNIQTQINNILNGSSTKYSTTIDIMVGSFGYVISHNLGVLKPGVRIIDETSDSMILATPVYSSTTQLTIPITSSQAIAGVTVEVTVA